MCFMAKKARTWTTEAIFVNKFDKDFKNGPHQKTKQTNKKIFKKSVKGRDVCGNIQEGIKWRLPVTFPIESGCVIFLAHQCVAICTKHC